MRTETGNNRCPTQTRSIQRTNSIVDPPDVIYLATEEASTTPTNLALSARLFHLASRFSQLYDRRTDTERQDHRRRRVDSRSSAPSGTNCRPDKLRRSSPNRTKQPTGRTTLQFAAAIAAMASRSLRTGVGVGAGLARPSFSRANSAGSCASTKSEDSLTGTLRSLALESPQSSGFPPSNAIPIDENSRKRSAPIAIELPRSATHVYTPLTARGDLPGGYFPNHNPDHNKPRRPSGFSITDLTLTQRNHQPLDTPLNMSATSSAAGSPFPSPPMLPVPLMVPMGKYHPSNYQSPNQTNATNSRPSTSSSTPVPNMKLSVPKIRRGMSQTDRPEHKRQNSEVRQKLEKYQRDMIRQAKLAASKSKRKTGKPDSPKLTPFQGLGSPGMITPLELGSEAGDFLTAGERRRAAAGSNSSTGSEVATLVGETDDAASPLSML